MSCYACSKSGLTGKLARQIQTKLKEIQAIYIGSNTLYIASTEGQFV